MSGQAVRFVGVGVGATILHYAIMALLTSLGRLPAVPASQVGFVAGGVFSYAMNRGFTFQADVAHRRAAPRYVAAAAVGWCVNGVALAGLRAVFGSVWVAQLGATAIVAAVSFLLQRFMVFGAARGL